MIVSAFSLDRFENQACDVVLVLHKCILYLRNGSILRFDNSRQVFFVGICDLWIVYPRPVELRKVEDLCRIGVGKRKRVAASSVKRFLEVYYLMALLFFVSLLKILPDLPVECGLESILNCKRASSMKSCT